MINSKKNSRGFSLIELVIALAILAVIAVAGLSILTEQQSKARDARRKAHIEQMHKILEQYYADQGSYPVGDFEALTTLFSTQYLARISDIKDPVNKDEFVYTYVTPYPGISSGYCICAKLEKTTDGNSGALCDFAAAETHFCKKNIQ